MTVDSSVSWHEQIQLDIKTLVIKIFSCSTHADSQLSKTELDACQLLISCCTSGIPRGLAWSTGARCPVSPSRFSCKRTRKKAVALRARTHTPTHTHATTYRRTQMAPRYKKRTGCVSDLPDVSGNFRSMIYMGITSTDQTSIKSTKGAWSAGSICYRLYICFTLDFNKAQSEPASPSPSSSSSFGFLF